MFMCSQELERIFLCKKCDSPPNLVKHTVEKENDVRYSFSISEPYEPSKKMLALGIYCM